jgi:uncharacterized protein YbjT (DUF2867 family)
MSDIPYRSALIIGAGPGISGSLTRLLRAADIPVVIASRHPDRLAPGASGGLRTTFAQAEMLDLPP